MRPPKVRTLHPHEPKPADRAPSANFIRRIKCSGCLRCLLECTTMVRSSSTGRASARILPDGQPAHGRRRFRPNPTIPNCLDGERHGLSPLTTTVNGGAPNSPSFLQRPSRPVLTARAGRPASPQSSPWLRRLPWPSPIRRQPQQIAHPAEHTSSRAAAVGDMVRRAAFWSHALAIQVAATGCRAEPHRSRSHRTARPRWQQLPASRSGRVIPLLPAGWKATQAALRELVQELNGGL